MRVTRAHLSLAIIALGAIAGLFAAIPSAALIPSVPPAVPTIAYDRTLYKHWTDANRDCRDTRQEVLIAESFVQVTLDPKGCKVVRGEWHDPYTGKIFTDPKDLDVDHLVPLGEAHASGGYAWSPQRRQDYANNLSDPNTLIAVSLSANRSKGDKDPAHWLPSNPAFRCTYVEEWMEVKQRWGLVMDPAERTAIDRVLSSCAIAAVPTPRMRPRA
jgi:hypothetical protein